MKTSTLVIIAIVISITLLTWLVSIWQYDAMRFSMMTFYHNPAALSLFVVLLTTGMAAMMFHAIVPMILVFNRLVNMDNATSNNPDNSKKTVKWHITVAAMMVWNTPQQKVKTKVILSID